MSMGRSLEREKKLIKVIISKGERAISFGLVPT
jgi:hypothetical protein